MVNSTSLSLLQRLAADGSDADWSKLVSIYSSFIRLRINSYPDLAPHLDDIVQEVFLVLMRELPTFQRRQTGSFRTFLRHVTVNQLRNYARKIRRETAKGLLNQQIEELADPGSIASSQWNDEHDSAVFQRVIEIVRDDFEEQTWTIFERYGLNQESASVVAESLGVTVGAVMSAKSRVLRRMREEAAGLLDRTCAEVRRRLALGSGEAASAGVRLGIRDSSELLYVVVEDASLVDAC